MDKISPIKERILKFIENQGIKKIDFCEVTGISYANLKGKSLFSEIGGDKIAEILSIYPTINSEWLLTGKGSMLKEMPITSVISESSARSDRNHRQIPIIDIEAAAGSGKLNTDYVEVLGHISIPVKSLQKRSAVYYAIRSRGDSMFPTIYDKDFLIVRLLDVSEWDSIRDEYIYIVVDREGKSFVKRIKNRLDRGFIVLTSDNLDKYNYPNFTLDVEELQHFLYVEMKISPHLPNLNASYYTRLKELEDRFDEMEARLNQKSE